MDFAIIEDGVVTNVIVGPLPNGMDGVALNGRPVAIGDTYINDVFLRNETPVLTDAEQIAQLEAALAAIEGELNA